jgi:acylphosphatase
MFWLDLQGTRFYKTVIMQGTEGYIRVCLTVTGTVQGVGFRYWARQVASALGVQGQVSNNPDGSVDAVFCGATDAVEEMIRLCTEGPASAVVDKLKVVSRDFTVHCPPGFRILQ